ncbi:hypothetical protein EI555_018042 [Monodon monoceros]|uniref:RRM domain-containing protein n=1 Tax=Monodon monoceros TaxID=40151 RepID=A0A4U1FQZ9_MONMO|nr:hypothetical protein EI555_018042 [Monodon monoceros]
MTRAVQTCKARKSQMFCNAKRIQTQSYGWTYQFPKGEGKGLRFCGKFFDIVIVVSTEITCKEWTFRTCDYCFLISRIDGEKKTIAFVFSDPPTKSRGPQTMQIPIALTIRDNLKTVDDVTHSELSLLLAASLTAPKAEGNGEGRSLVFKVGDSQSQETSQTSELCGDAEAPVNRKQTLTLSPSNSIGSKYPPRMQRGGIRTGSIANDYIHQARNPSPSRLVYDRETGKPKGCGFCEYQDQETALSAMRNLNGCEFSGRALRVDSAASKKNKEELKSLGTGAPVIESPYGETISPEDAPESISKAVASLPPEQMFELMKQMKLCVQNSPQEARNMSLQNPQLAYALLQAQVVMRTVDPEIALKILHRQTNIPTLIAGNPQTVHSAGPGSGSNVSINQQNPQAPQAQSLSGMHVNGAHPLMQASLQAGVAAPGQIPAIVTGPGPGSLAPGGGIQAQVGMPGSGPVSMEWAQVPM